MALHTNFIVHLVRLTLHDVFAIHLNNLTQFFPTILDAEADSMMAIYHSVRVYLPPIVYAWFLFSVLSFTVHLKITSAELVRSRPH